MDELIGRLAVKAGIDGAVAEKTIGIILGFLRNEGPSDKVQALIDQIPGAEAAIAASGNGGSLGNLMGGGRKALAAKTGIGEQQLLEWANVSDYMRIPGMGKAKVGLVRAAGVATVRELALRNPARLAESMKEVNTKRRLVRVLPSEKSVEQLIAQARKLQPKITY